MTPFTGTINELTDLDVSDHADWLLEAPVDSWHKMADEAWRGWGARFRPLAEELTAAHYPGCWVPGLMLATLSPGQCQMAHIDEQQPGHLVRIHVPILTNPHAVMTMPDGPRHMLVGKAYRFNTQVPHSLYNGGRDPRVHFIFDVIT